MVITVFFLTWDMLLPSARDVGPQPLQALREFSLLNQVPTTYVCGFQALTACVAFVADGTCYVFHKPACMYKAESSSKNGAPKTNQRHGTKEGTW